MEQLDLFDILFSSTSWFLFFVLFFLTFTFWIKIINDNANKRRPLVFVLFINSEIERAKVIIIIYYQIVFPIFIVFSSIFPFFFNCNFCLISLRGRFQLCEKTN